MEPTVGLKEPKPDKRTIEQVVTALQKQFGPGVLMKLGDEIPDVPVISTGSLNIDRALGIGGVPRGRITEIWGPEGCLDADTFIQYEVRSPGGRRQSHRGGSIQRLYERFHGLPRKGKGYYQRLQTKNSEYYIMSVTPTARVVRNRVVGVVRHGMEECFRLTTEGGHEIVATADHNFLVAGNFGDPMYATYSSLSELRAGVAVYIHDNSRYAGPGTPRQPRPEVLVKYHPGWHTKVIDRKYTYCRGQVAWATVEAALNDMEYDKYIEFLNTASHEEIDNLWHVPGDLIVHHADKNPTNNSLDNLRIMSKMEHDRLHALNNLDHLSFVAQMDIVKSIVPVGKRDTYDIQCQAPLNNYVANGIVVHNSGKTTLAQHIVAEAQKNGGVAVYIDMEHKTDAKYMAACGIDLDRLYLSQPQSGTVALDLVRNLVASDQVDAIIVDSVSALTSSVELDASAGDHFVGIQARMMSQNLKAIVGALGLSKTALVFINQTRMKIGVMYGSPETTSGGVALRFYASVRMRISRIKNLGPKGKEYGIQSRVKIRKNCVAPPWQEVEIDIEWGKGIACEADVLDAAVKAGVVKQAGGWYSFGDVKVGGRGRETAKAYLAEHPDLVEEIRERVLSGGTNEQD